MRRSWLDVFTDLVDRAPAPRWAVYGAIFAGGGAAVHVAAWADGTLAFPELAPVMLISAVFPVVFPWAMQILDGVALRSLQKLDPALDLAPAAQDELARELIRTPVRSSTVLGAVGLLAGVASVLGSPPANYGLRSADQNPTWAVTIFLSAATMALLFGLLGHVAHQLRVVDRVHRSAVRVDLSHLAPLYAFSTFTARTGIALLAITVGSLALLNVATGGTLVLAPSDYAVTAALFGVSIACFIYPLLGLHGRIADEKDRRVAEASAALGAVLAEVQRRISARDVEGAGRLNDSVAAANAALLAVSRVSTWPWHPETLRGFVSAVMLPIGLGVLFEMLRRLPR